MDKKTTANIAPVERAKRRLRAFRDLQEDIDFKVERLQRLREKITALPSSNMTGMPRSPGRGDRASSLIARAVDLEKDIAKMRAKEAAEYEAIQLITLSMPKASERAIIQMRYLDHAKWPEICESLYQDRFDYDDNIENYMRQTFERHGRALCSFAAVENNVKNGEKTGDS